MRSKLRVFRQKDYHEARVQIGVNSNKPLEEIELDGSRAP